MQGEWLAACVAFGGVLGLGLSAEAHHMDHPDHLHPLRILLGFCSMVGLMGAWGGGQGDKDRGGGGGRRGGRGRDVVRPQPEG